jgi:deazaflavin-dependent oxidoreductase (nitroreductase family)
MSSVPQFSRAEMETFHGKVIDEFRANRGKVGGQFADAPLLLLTTTGAKSGQPHTTPVTYGQDYSRFVVIAAKRGEPTNPDWYHNLVANPNVTVEVGDETFRAVAHVAQGEERQRLFDELAAQRPNFREFQSKTSRQLPVVVLEPILDNKTDYNAFNRRFIGEFHARGGKAGGIFEGRPVLLLTTTGARSGQSRVNPLLYGLDDERPVIVASKGGSPTHPDWYRNILANPDVTVEIGMESFPARARVTDGAERQRLFTMLKGVVPMLDEAQAKTTGQLPIVVLERAGT